MKVRNDRQCLSVLDWWRNQQCSLKPFPKCSLFTVTWACTFPEFGAILQNLGCFFFMMEAFFDAAASLSICTVTVMLAVPSNANTAVAFGKNSCFPLSGWLIMQKMFYVHRLSIEHILLWTYTLMHFRGRISFVCNVHRTVTSTCLWK